MVSGSQNNSRTKGAKKKQKMVLAKDKNQLILAIVVLLIFFGNTIYMVAKGISQNMADQAALNQPASTAPQSATNNDPLLSGQNPTSTTPPPVNPEQAGAPVAATDPTVMVEQNMPPAAPQPVEAAGINPIIPILIVLLVLGLIFVLVKFLSKQNLQLGNNKFPPGKKPKMVLAKDKNQLIAAGVVLAIFVGNTVYMIAKGISENMAENAAMKNAETTMAQQQQNNMEGLMDPSLRKPSDDGITPTPGSENIAQDTNDIYAQTLSLQGQQPNKNPNAGNTARIDAESDVEIMPKRALSKKSGKMVLISVSDAGRSNPFLPANENIMASSLPKLNLLSPPEEAYVGSEAGKVMTTTISGILYDKYSPSAIINIEGSDYLVKRGDVINHYKILSIEKNQVLVQLGKNIYKAGVGELLSQTNINYNTIANLNKKFGGNDVSINVKRKGY